MQSRDGLHKAVTGRPSPQAYRWGEWKRVTDREGGACGEDRIVSERSIWKPMVTKQDTCLVTFNYDMVTGRKRGGFNRQNEIKQDRYGKITLMYPALNSMLWLLSGCMCHSNIDSLFSLMLFLLDMCNYRFLQSNSRRNVWTVVPLHPWYHTSEKKTHRTDAKSIGKDAGLFSRKWEIIAVLE